MHPSDTTPEHVLWVCAALNAKAQDRRMQREALHPVQRIVRGRAEVLPYFAHMGELGVSALILLRSNALVLSTGRTLMHIDIGNGLVRHLNVDGLIDAHEMSLIGDCLWIANTGADEV